MKRILWTISVLASQLQASEPCSFPGQPPQAAIQLAPFVTGLDRPVKMVALPGADDRFWVVEQVGKIREIKGGVIAERPVLDIRDRVTQIGAGGDERGFLGLALHPQFSTNRRIFVNYTTRGSLRTRISEFKAQSNGTADPRSERVILEIAQPYGNHNGGEVAFGPDGFLYIGMGDGGSAGDPQGNAQNLQSLLGKMLRIDVDHGDPYSIPVDNPTLSKNRRARQEIYAYGLRNPWRFSFDRVTGELWTGDVGQNQWEEVDIIRKGKNYGWNIMEGNVCYQNASCNQENLEKPIAVYSHNNDGISITGGFVYRGKKIPALLGTYIFADYGTGRVWGLKYENGLVATHRELLASGQSIAAFGEDSAGEIYMLDLDGSISRIEAPSATSAFPLTLSATGCFNQVAPLLPAANVVPFEVNAPLWSDGLAKDRFIHVPKALKFVQDGRWDYPVGTVFIKNFFLPGTTPSERRIIETRFLVKQRTNFAGFSYYWNEDETEAYLLGGAIERPVTLIENGASVDFNFYYPSQGDCVRCHTEGAGTILGFTPQQLNKTLAAGKNQLHALEAAGVFAKDSVGDVSQLPHIPNYNDESLPIAVRARSYLHVQCSSCHNPKTTAGQMAYDMRYETPFVETKLCNTMPHHGDAGVQGALVIKPGDASHSVLWIRAHSLNREIKMPPLATARRAEAGVAAVKQWIDGMSGCN